MCGIVAVLRRPSARGAPDPAALLGALDRLVSLAPDAGVLTAAAVALEPVDVALRGVPGLETLVAHPDVAVEIDVRIARLADDLARVEAELDQDGPEPGVVEAVNAQLLRVKDVVWAIRRDRLATARAVVDLAGDASVEARGVLEGALSIQVALAALDRLEVRGRDSAGLEVLLHGDGDAPRAFVYKTAAEIGELGDNTAALRAAIQCDNGLWHRLAANDVRSLVLGHTRWASIGAVTESNAHPIDETVTTAEPLPHVAVAQNGDVDNYADFLGEIEIAGDITTDAKVVPVLVARRIAAGSDPVDAFRTTVAALEGSLAIAASTSVEPDRLLLSLRGTGQALYVGVADDTYVVASEPYGLVEESRHYLQLDGEAAADAENPVASRGQIVALDVRRAGELDAIERWSFDGTSLPVGESELTDTEITTRDIDRGEATHYLLKEVGEAPASFRKTLRGRITERDGDLRVVLPDESFPASLRERVRSGAIRRVVVIGQGTAAVAGESIVATLRDTSSLIVDALPATELSGFGLDDDMHDTLVVAISQSGTTTDTNRTVDLAQVRGAGVIAIVNRRNSDLASRADGVLFTSDGRDVEMAVASTKAFYAQVAGGILLALAIADELGLDPDASQQLLEGLRALPDAMTAVFERRPEIATAAQRHVLSRRYWAVVGNGPNRVAAREVRIKLSELCYKSIASDVTEDKKHIDLSAEPLILVCAAGLSGSNADDVAKEIAIYRAHRAAPIVVATEGDDRFDAALETIPVPAVHPGLAFVLSAMAGHLFSYEAALAIDASARPLREARAAIEGLVGETDPERVLDLLRERISVPASRFQAGLFAGDYDGALEASTAVVIASRLRYATGLVPLDGYELEHGKVGTPSTMLEDLAAALGDGIGQLTRPVDAIKHQAKTVTVGISRSDETLLRVPLVREVLGAGAARDSLSYRSLRTLVELDRAVAEVTGYTRYRIEGDGDGATIHVVDRGGIATELRSRTDDNPTLRGIKHRVATEREVTVARGHADGRTLVIVPEVKGNQAVGLTLLHARYHDRVPAQAARSVLEGYRDRYGALRDAVLETEASFDDTRLADIELVDLLTVPVHVMAERWRSP